MARLKLWWERQSLFFRYFVLVFAILTLVIGGVEVCLEAWVARRLGFIDADMHGWHEAALWGVSILIPSLLCGYLFARGISRKLDRIARLARNLSGGNLEARLPVNGNSPDAFNQLMLSLNGMADALSGLLRNERRLLLDISHELRSPLARLNIAAALLQRTGPGPLNSPNSPNFPGEANFLGDENFTGDANPPGEANAPNFSNFPDSPGLPGSPGFPDAVELGARMEKEIDYMSRLVESLLSQGRSTLNADEEPRPLRLDRLLEELADDFAFQGSAQRKKVRRALRKDCLIYGKSALLKSLFGNILANALYYTPPGGKVLVRSAESGADLIVRIRDFGPGVPENHLEDIFRPFYRLDEARAKDSGGAGLGLALAKEAALGHGGGISAANAHPGLEIVVTLPLYRPEEARLLEA